MKLRSLVSWGSAVALAAVSVGWTLETRARGRAETKSTGLEATLFTARTDLANAAARAETLASQTIAAQAEVQEVKSQLTAAETRLIGLARELDAAKETAVEAQAELSRTAATLEDLRRELVQTRLNASQAVAAAVEEYRGTIAELQTELRQVTDRLAAAAHPSTAPAGLKVLSVGPSDAFVVLNFGSARGAAVNQKLLVRRESDPLATVTISDVREHHSIAQVQPASLRGSLRHGDSVTLLH